MSPERRWIDAPDGAKISYLVFEGAGPTLVMLHGLAGSAREFIPTALALAGRRVILVDQRGHGMSTTHPADVSRRAFVDDVVQVIEAESTEPIDVAGQSMGAHTAMLVAAAFPERVRRLVLLEGNQGSGSAEDQDALGAFFRSWPLPFDSRAAASKVLGDGPIARAWIEDLEERPDGLYPRFDPDVMVSILGGVRQPRWEAWWSITTPTLVIFADGGMFTAEEKDAFVASRANVARRDLVGASHDAHLDAFDQWVTELVDFISAD